MQQFQEQKHDIIIFISLLSIAMRSNSSSVNPRSSRFDSLRVATAVAWLGCWLGAIGCWLMGGVDVATGEVAGWSRVDGRRGGSGVPWPRPRLHFPVGFLGVGKRLPTTDADAADAMDVCAGVKPANTLGEVCWLLYALRGDVCVVILTGTRVTK